MPPTGSGMPNMADLKMQQKWEDMAAYMYVILRHIPKSERFTLGVELRSSVWKGLRLIVQANTSHRRLGILGELDSEIKVLLALVRTAHKMRLIPDKQYATLSEQLVELGRMLGGWMKYSRA
jgi:hypothetical protein